MDALQLQQIFDRLAAAYTRQLGLRVAAIEQPGVVRIEWPVRGEFVHGGGVVCGQSILAAADTAMLLAMISQLGEFKPMTTANLQTSFLRPIPKDVPRIDVIARVLRHGKTLSYGEVSFSTPDGKLAAHATSTYALL